MSRVHDALRRAEQISGQTPAAPANVPTAVAEPVLPEEAELPSAPVPAAAYIAPFTAVAAPAMPGEVGLDLLRRVRKVPYTPAPDTHLIDLNNPHEAPAEEFRSLRTRLNHMQTLQPIHTVVFTSPSPAEGKSFAAVNFAITESQLEGNNTLIIDCDFRRPIVHTLFQVDRGPGMTDFLQGKASIEDCIQKVGNTNLYVIPAGEPVVNPLELLNLREMRMLLDQLPNAFNWVVLDSPPLLFAADANLLSTMSSGAVLVVRIGTTTVDSVSRAIQSLCEDNVLGVVVNGARRGELYSKYTYYHSYYYTNPDEEAAKAEEEEE